MSKRRPSSASSTPEIAEDLSSPRYSTDLKRACLALVKGKGGPPISLPTVAQYDGFPTERTIRRWRHEEENPQEPPDLALHRGPEPALSEDQLGIVGGYVLFCAEEHESCGWHEVADFIYDVFGVKIQQPWVSKHLSELGFSSHRPASLTNAFGTPRSIKAAVEFLEQNQKKLANVKDRSRVVAIDQISLWDCGIVERTYSLRGGHAFSADQLRKLLTLTNSGQPRIADVEPGTKHIVYTAFCADGSCLPPVIFLPDPVTQKLDSRGRYRVRCGGEEREAFLLYMPGLGNPSEASTQAWLRCVTRPDDHYFEDNPHIILDALKGHFAPEIEEDWENINAKTYRLPAASGKWLNPCDQSIHREMRRRFIQLQQRNRQAKVDNIIEAYYSVTDETVSNSFVKCGYSGRNIDDVIGEATHEGYKATAGREEAVARYPKAFGEWARSNVRSTFDTLPRKRAAGAGDSTLDGVYWAKYASSHRRAGAK